MMWPLLFCAIGLWFSLGFRFFLYLNLSQKVKDNSFTTDDKRLYLVCKDHFVSLIKSFLVISPLLGLLGTVSGMIETFDSLGDMQMYSQSGGIASGISKALFTTQLGLIISAPGLLFFKYVERNLMKLDFDHEGTVGALNNNEV